LENVTEENEEDEEKYSKKEEDKDNELSSIYEENENNDEIKPIKINRYYNIETDISLKCQICDQVGHRKENCPHYNIKFCYKCLSTTHDERDCNQVKCFRCNKLGHKTYICKLKENQLILCDKCQCIGHKKKMNV